MVKNRAGDISIAAIFNSVPRSGIIDLAEEFIWTATRKKNGIISLFRNNERLAGSSRAQWALLSEKIVKTRCLAYRVPDETFRHFL